VPAFLSARRWSAVLAEQERQRHAVERIAVVAGALPPGAAFWSG
jgi:hypothetical protein